MTSPATMRALLQTRVIFWPTMARSAPITEAGLDGDIIGDEDVPKSRPGVGGGVNDGDVGPLALGVF